MSRPLPPIVNLRPLRGGFARVGFAGLAFALVLGGALATAAETLRIFKPERPSAPPVATRSEVMNRAPAPESKYIYRRLPLDLPPVKPVFERRELERRSSALRNGPDTVVVKVAVLRIEFATDRKGDLTTGDGRMMRVNSDTLRLFIDPPPHNEAYFLDHIEAANRYWQSISYGLAKVEGDVFPRGLEYGSYVLPDMADYGPRNEDEFFSIEGLTNFFRDCLMAADADPDLDWDTYDMILITHAGSDWQNDVFQDSPFDLPTFSITLSDSEAVLSDEGDTLTTGVVFPETTSQDGFNVALNGAIAHEMGHQFGLFDIYNIETFSPTVGYYSLMDSGNLAGAYTENPAGEIVEVIGLLPTAIGAWQRWLLLYSFGYEPTLVTQDVPRARLRAIQSRVAEAALPPNTKKWYRLPISDTEYFLLENRVDDLDGRTPSGEIRTAIKRNPDTGVVLGPVMLDNQLEETGDISHNYDYLIVPGLLIWHVDERQVLANFSQGRGINVFFEKRGVTIEEADGLVDIGSPYSYFQLGTDKETFHADNNANFTPYTRPNSDTNLGAPSNIFVMNIGPRDTTMVMDISFSSKPRGWPVEIAPYGATAGLAAIAADADGQEGAEIAVASDSCAFLFRYEDSETDDDDVVDTAGDWPQPAPDMRTFGRPAYTPALGDVDGDGRLEMLVVTDSGSVYCWNDDGTPVAAADSVGLVLSFGAAARATWSAIPADLSGDGVDEVYLVTQDARLHGFDLSVSPPDSLFPSRPLLGNYPDPADSLVSTLAFGDLTADDRLDGIVSYVYQDSVHIQKFDTDGRRILRLGYPLPQGHAARRVFLGLADVDRSSENNDLEIVLVTDTGWILVADRAGAPCAGWPQTVTGPVGGPPAFGDLDGDGLLEIAITSAGHHVNAFNYNGTQMVGWPVYVALADYPGYGQAASPPVIADVDGDGRQDVLAGFTDFTIRALDADGEEIPGFPLMVGGPADAPPAILDANGDGRLDLFVQNYDGRVYARILPGLASSENPAWGMLGGGPRLHGSFDEARLPQLRADDSVVLRGPITVYPNPVFHQHGQITIRYTLGNGLARASEVEISIYNLAGEVVERLQGPVYENTENVVTLAGDRFASGVYLCTVRARSGDRVATNQQKFAVIR